MNFYNTIERYLNHARYSNWWRPIFITTGWGDTGKFLPRDTGFHVVLRAAKDTQYTGILFLSYGFYIGEYRMFPEMSVYQFFNGTPIYAYSNPYNNPVAGEEIAKEQIKKYEEQEHQKCNLCSKKDCPKPSSIWKKNSNIEEIGKFRQMCSIIAEIMEYDNQICIIDSTEKSEFFLRSWESDDGDNPENRLKHKNEVNCGTLIELWLPYQNELQIIHNAIIDGRL